MSSRLCDNFYDRYDERDTIFSRMQELQEGSKRYQQYYSRHPEKEAADSKLRQHPPGLFSDRLWEQNQIDSIFGLIEKLRPLAGHCETAGSAGAAGAADSAGAAGAASVPDNITEKLKRMISSYGAVLCGVTRTDPAWLYSVRGRGAVYGSPVEDYLPNTIVFAVEMDEAEINRAPAVAESVEVVRGYLNAAMIGLALQSCIKGLGYKAVCHMDGMSEIVLPPAAEAAGIGSIGLHGVLVTREYGPRIRLGAVTTNIPLEIDNRKVFDVTKICRNCGKCAELCPSNCIPGFDSYESDRNEKRIRFTIDDDKCFKTWRELGTDCGVCLAACPFSHSKGGATGAGERNTAGSAGFLKDFMFGKGAQNN